MNERRDYHCIHCGTEGFDAIKEEFDGMEAHITSNCYKCRKNTVFLYNLVWYNTVTPEELKAGDVEASHDPPKTEPYDLKDLCTVCYKRIATDDFMMCEECEKARYKEPV